MGNKTDHLRPLSCGTVRTINNWSMLLVQFCHDTSQRDQYIRVHSWFYLGKN